MFTELSRYLWSITKAHTTEYTEYCASGQLNHHFINRSLSGVDSEKSEDKLNENWSPRQVFELRSMKLLSLSNYDDHLSFAVGDLHPVHLHHYRIRASIPTTTDSMAILHLPLSIDKHSPSIKSLHPSIEPRKSSQNSARQSLAILP